MRVLVTGATSLIGMHQMATEPYVSQILGSSQVQLRLRFNTLTVQAAANEGWFMDNLSILIKRT